MGRSSRYIWVTLGLISAAAAFLAAYLTASREYKLSPVILWSVLAVLVAVAVAVPAVSLTWSEYRRRKLSGRLSSIEIPGGSVTQAPEPEAPHQVGPPDVNAEDLRLKVHTLLLSEAETVLARYLGANVRHAKRLVNQWLLYRQIAYFRKVFDDSPALGELHLVRWLVLGDKWPALAAALTSDPAKMEALEAADSIAALRKAITSLAPAKVASQELLAFLKEQPPLAPVLAQLVEFRPTPVTDVQAESAVADHGADAPDVAALSGGSASR